MLKAVSSVRMRFVGVREEVEVEERLDELDILGVESDCWLRCVFLDGLYQSSASCVHLRVEWLWDFCLN